MRILIALTTLLLAVSGVADSWSWTFTDGSGLVAFGTLEGDLFSSGEFNITSGTITDLDFGAPGTITGTIISNPVAPGQATSPSGYFLYDDQLFPSSAPDFWDVYGLLFGMVGGAEINVWDNGGGAYMKYANTGQNDSGVFAIVPTPEPGAVSLLVTMLAGLVGLAGALKRKLA